MIRSMTGYGQGKCQLAGGTITVELRSVNHRYGEVVVRLPRALMPLELRVRDVLKEGVRRGRLELHGELEFTGGSVRASVDHDLAAFYYQSLMQLKAVLDLPDRVALSDLVRLPDIVHVREAELDLEQVWTALQDAVEQALAELIAMRELEGRRLALQVKSGLELIATMVAIIEERSGDMVPRYRERLKKRMAQLLEDVSADEGRLAQELALLADRSCIAEEVVRLRSHLDQCRECLEQGGPVGRRMDFLCQELHREINTIAAKSADVEVSRLVVDLKSELEKLREQAQNIE